MFFSILSLLSHSFSLTHTEWVKEYIDIYIYKIDVGYVKCVIVLKSHRHLNVLRTCYRNATFNLNQNRENLKEKRKTNELKLKRKGKQK